MMILLIVQMTGEKGSQPAAVENASAGEAAPASAAPAKRQLDYVPVPAAGPGEWTELRRGQGTENFFFERQADVVRYFGESAAADVEVLKTDPYASAIHVSPASPNGRYFVLAVDDPGTSSVQLFDRGQRKARALDLLNSPGRWVSWSPDGAYALLSSSGEGLHRLLQVQLETGRMKELSRRGWGAPQILRAGLNEWGTAEQQVMADGKSVNWSDAQNYRVLLNVHCNPYVVPNCDHRTVLKTVELACRVGDARCRETGAR